MKRINTDRRVLLAGIGGVMAGSLLVNKTYAGTLNPPGPPMPTGKSTDELASMIARPSGVSEPRTPVKGLPPGQNALHHISESGSYCMTENLIGAAGSHGIFIDASNVDLHLQGFHLVGAAGTPGGAGVAIVCTGQNVCIYDGTIEGWTIGVQMDAASKFLLWDVTVLGASLAGFTLGTDGQAYDCDVYSCPVGFDMHGQRTLVEECGAWSCPTSFQCSGTQNLLLSNCATGSMNPFAIGPGNAFGPIVVVSGVGDIGAVAGSSHVSANLVY